MGPPPLNCSDFCSSLNNVRSGSADQNSGHGIVLRAGANNCAMWKSLALGLVNFKHSRSSIWCSKGTRAQCRGGAGASANALLGG
jgi:hypothetical protein